MQDDWEKKIVPRLPAGSPEKAHELKAFQRARAFEQPEDLLRGLLYYVTGARSFAEVGVWGVIQQIANVSASDWRRRLRGASSWLDWLLRETLASSAPVSPWLVRGAWMRILLVDGTHLHCPGLHGTTWRLHTAVDLLQGRLSQVHVTDQSVPEQLTFFEIGPGDLIVGDNATGYAQRITYVHDHQADILTRFSPATLPLYTQQQERIHVLRWLKGRHARSGTICSMDGYIERENEIRPSRQRRTERRKGQLHELIPVRLIAYRLKPEAQNRAERRARRRASKGQRQIQADTIYLSHWIVVVTTLPKEQWSDEDILRLYQARWHIELMFKRIKQFLSVHRLRCETPQTAHATLTAILLAWALMEEGTQSLRQSLTEAMQLVHADQSGGLPPLELEMTVSPWERRPEGDVSQWMLTSLSVKLFCDQVKGEALTEQRVKTHLPQLTRFLHQGVRQRRSLYCDVCQWLVHPSVSRKTSQRQRTA
jgi:hypothetical protein